MPWLQQLTAVPKLLNVTIDNMYGFHGKNIPNTDLLPLLDLPLGQHLHSALLRVHDVPGIGCTAVVDQGVDWEKSSCSEAGHVACVRAEHPKGVKDFLFREFVNLASVPDERDDSLKYSPVLSLLNVLKVVNKSNCIGGL